MNNFVLNNTSVYLGGQCQWDIVINKNKDHLEIGGFQLAPISGNVPYNRKGEIRNLNNTHSDTLKIFCNNLKESFWCTDFCADTFINSSNNVVDSNDLELDTSLFAGLKRVSDYSIYKKQFCFFQPVWLENIPEGSYLRFNFTVHPAGYPNNVLGSNWIDFKILDDNLFDPFHNQFVNYFNNWVEYVKVTNPIYRYDTYEKDNDDTSIIDEVDEFIQNPTKKDPEKISVPYYKYYQKTPNGQSYTYEEPLESISSVDEESIVEVSKIPEHPTSNNNIFPEYIKIKNYNYYVKTIVGNSGNDRSMYIDLQKEETRLSGVSTLTGQIINGVNCDYVVSNLLMNERPNVETDYILSTLFKSHNLINSQLFNFNFCFNIDDILSGFIIKQLYGSKIYISCDVYLVNESGKTEKLENRTLFTNYNYVKKSVYNPFIFIDDIVLDEYDNIIETNYKCVPVIEQKDNVLDYLKDYEVGSVKDINKLNQNICHWNYTDIKDKNFNLYNGYQYIYYNYDINNIPCDIEVKETDEYTYYQKVLLGNTFTYKTEEYNPSHEYSLETSLPSTPNSSSPPYIKIKKVIKFATYQYTPIEILYSNEVSTYSYPNIYMGNGELSWIYPKQIIYINSHREDGVDVTANTIYQELMQKLNNKGEIGLIYKNHLSIDIMNEIWGTHVNVNDLYTDQKIDKICCVYIRINDTDWGTLKNSLLLQAYKPIQINSSLTLCIDSGVGVILTNDPNCLLLDNLIDICDHPNWGSSTPSQTLIDQLSDVTITLKGIKESILQGNEGYFYQFGKEICIGYNDLNEKTYYKSDTLNTYLYRIGGKISPAFLQDSEHNINGYYGYDNRNKSIIIVSDQDANNSFEISKNGSGWRMLLDTELEFTVTKDTYNNDLSLNDLIKSYLSTLYKITNKFVIDEIFSKYFVSFDYEYDYKIIEGKTQVTTIYKVKLILR